MFNVIVRADSPTSPTTDTPVQKTSPNINSRVYFKKCNKNFIFILKNFWPLICLLCFKLVEGSTAKCIPIPENGDFYVSLSNVHNVSVSAIMLRGDDNHLVDEYLYNKSIKGCKDAKSQDVTKDL